MKKDNEPSDLSDVIGGTLNIFGLKLDLAQLLSAPEDVREQLQQLREKLKQAGGKETMSAEEWKAGGTAISGHFRTSGILGEREYHIGTAGPGMRRTSRKRASEPREAAEPPMDVFQEAEEVVVVAEVPGIDMADLELKVEDDSLLLSTRPDAPRSYRKRVGLGPGVDRDSLRATCQNGILEVHLRRKAR